MAIECDNAAIMAGYTRQVEVEGPNGEWFTALVKPDADLDGMVEAFDQDNQEIIRFKGWMALISDVEA